MWYNYVMEQVKAGESRDNQGRFVKGVSGNPKGLTKLTEAQKLEKKANKVALEQRITEYKETLGDALPLISPVLIKKAVEGDMQAIKEVNSVVVGKAPTDESHGNTFNTLIISVEQQRRIAEHVLRRRTEEHSPQQQKIAQELLRLKSTA